MNCWPSYPAPRQLNRTITARRVEFGFLRTTLQLTAGNLGQHLTVLENAGLVQIEKGYEGKRPRTWVELTPAGQTALRQEIAYLKQLIHQVEQPPAVAAGDPAEQPGV